MLIVKKFGGTSVADKDRIFNVAKRCIRDYEAGNDVVVVLSAMGKYTDELIAKAKQAKNPEELLALAKENGVELTEESAKAYFNQLNPKTGELADDELDNVAGGGCHNGGRLVVRSEENSSERRSQVESSKAVLCMKQ